MGLLLNDWNLLSMCKCDTIGYIIYETHRGKMPRAERRVGPLLLSQKSGVFLRFLFFSKNIIEKIIEIFNDIFDEMKCGCDPISC
jgi:hypothetical protein